VAQRKQASRDTRKTLRLDRAEWLRLSLDQLARGGGAKLRIETLCQQLKVSRGSFYWHFLNRREFDEALIDYWDMVFTRGPMEQHRAMQGSGKDRLLWLMEILQQGQLGRYDMAVRAWAAQEPNLAARVARVDIGRLDYLRSIFAEIGFRGAELDMRTRLFVGFHSMESALHSDLTEAKKKTHLRLRHALLTRR